jgi:hypothetical protein
MIIINSAGIKTIVREVDGQPDFTSFSDSTKTILQAAYNRGDYEVIPDPEPINELPQPNWDGLYLTLMNSSVYADLVIIGQQLSGVDGALDKTIDAIQYGIFKPDSVAAFPAFQSAINLLMYVLMENQITLSTEQLQQVRGALDSNGFNSIQLQ